MRDGGVTQHIDLFTQFSYWNWQTKVPFHKPYEGN